MILQNLSILNYRNIRTATLQFSPKLNCFVGHNGAGKTNVLDAIYFLSFCRSTINPIDSQVITHDESFFVLEGSYRNEASTDITLYAGMKRGTKKVFKRNAKAYKRLSDHIGLVPLVIVAPSDTLLIDGGSEERRRLMDMVISQHDHLYLDALTKYNRALQQRNTLLKMEEEPEEALLSLWEEQMAESGTLIFTTRQRFIEDIVNHFQPFYQTIAGANEQVGIAYVSHGQRGDLLEVIRKGRTKDRIMGYSLHGVHRDDLVFTLDGHPLKREGSQGQTKSFVIALKLALFEHLKQNNAHTVPLLLLDDIFDKLDAQRVEKIVELVAGDDFGQIFITDTNREHLDSILHRSVHDYQIFYVENGEISNTPPTKEQ